MRKNVLITGAARGIGKAISKFLLKNNEYNLILLDKNADTLLNTYNEFKNSSPESMITRYMCDVSNSSDVTQVIESIKKHGNIPDILINNAGYGGPFHLITEVTDSEWEDVVFTNLKGVFNLCRAIIPLMEKKQWGRIINIASINGLFGAKYSSTYVASKHGVIGYTKSIAAEWGGSGITCNAICPGYVATNMGSQDDKIDNHKQKILNRTPIKRMATSEEIASLVNHLINENSGFINGSIITIDGGLTADIGIT